MGRMNRAAAAVASVAIASGVFWLGRITAPARPPAAVELRRSEHPGWVEVWREGELDSEWHETKDPELWRVIDQLLRDAPELYQSPTPGEPRRGRGPVLQASQ